MEHDVPEQTLLNLVESESNWNPNAVGDKGCSFGLVQINVCANNNPKEKYYATKEQALDPEFALIYAAKAIKAGDESRWTPCNCYSFVSILTDIEGRVTPNSTPNKGSVAVFDYDGVPHYGYVTELRVDGFTIREANYEPCKAGVRFVKWEDPSLKGFYTPTTSPQAH